jgi:hypothetical protein
LSGGITYFCENDKSRPGQVAILTLESVFELEKNPKLLLAMEDKILAILADGEVRDSRPGYEWES